MKKERFFGKNGQTAFLGAAVLVLLICYIDNFHGGEAPGSLLIFSMWQLTV